MWPASCFPLRVSKSMDGIYWPNVLIDPSPEAILRTKQTARRQNNKSQKSGAPLDWGTKLLLHLKEKLFQFRLKIKAPLVGATEEACTLWYHLVPQEDQGRANTHMPHVFTATSCFHFFSSKNTRFWEFGLPNKLQWLINNLFPGFFCIKDMSNCKLNNLITMR